MRYDIGFDYQGYKLTAMGKDLHEYERAEIFDRILYDLAIYFNNYQLFFIVGSLLTYLPLSWFCLKQSRDPVLSFMVYLFYPFMFLESMSSVRNYIAYSFILIALAMIIRNKIWKALIWIAIATGFHVSAVLAVLLIPIYKIKIGLKVQWLMWIASFFLMVVLENYLENLQSENAMVAIFLKYAEAKQQGGGTFTILVNMLCVILLLSWSKIKKCRTENEGLLRLFLFGVCIWNILGFDIVTRSRISLYFMLSMLLLIPELTVAIKLKGYKLRRLTFLFFFAVFISAFAINIKGNLTEKTKISFLPYQVYFLPHVDYDRNEVTFDE